MNWRAFWAIVRRELARGRRRMAVLSALGVAAMVGAIVLPVVVGVVIGSLVMLCSLFAVFAPLGDLRVDKTLGHLEFDRVLPVSHRSMATARLLGAAARVTPVIPMAVPLLIDLYRAKEVGLLVAAVLLIAVPICVWLLSCALLWLLMAINVRWNLRHLWWVPMTIGYSPTLLRSLLPARAKAAIAQGVAGFFDRHGDQLATFVGSPPGIAAIGVVVVAIPAVMLYGMVSLFASGLDRYTYDASAAVPMRAKPPKRELAAIGRGPALAVTRYCIRLAAEQSRRRLLLLVVCVGVLLVGTPELKNYAQFYVRALAAMIPGGIAIQLSTARIRGDLEGIQQLPHPAISIGVGYLLGIVVLSAPGAAVWVLARSVTGIPATLTNVLSLWGWMVAWSWLACVVMLWLTTRRTLLIVAVPVVALTSWAAYAGVDRFVEGIKAMAVAFGEFRVTAGAALPLSVAGAMIVQGLPLFARGLAEFEFGEARKAGRWLRFGNRPRSL